MGVPRLEQTPGIEQPWAGIWQATLRQLKEQGTWVVAQRALLDEYIYALREAARARDDEEWGAYDKHSKRVLAFADALGLTVKSRKAAGLARKEADDGDQDSELAELYAFAPRTRANSA